MYITMTQALDEPDKYYLHWLQVEESLSKEDLIIKVPIPLKASINDCINIMRLKYKTIKEDYDVPDITLLEDFIYTYRADICSH